MLNTSFVISSTHPSLAGHFPGHPVTPGVVTLDHVVRGLISQIPGASLGGLPQVKFLRPLLPEVEVKASYKLKHENLYQFSCECDDTVILSGQIRLIIGDI